MKGDKHFAYASAKRYHATIYLILQSVTYENKTLRIKHYTEVYKAMSQYIYIYIIILYNVLV